MRIVDVVRRRRRDRGVGAVPADDGSPGYREDGFRVLAAALARGLDVTLLPRQVLLARAPRRDAGGGGSGTPTRACSFVHGVPESSTLAGVTFAQDKRISRGLLERSGVPVARGATFAFRAVERAVEHSAELGYPVEISPALSDSTVYAPIEVANEDELRGAIERLRVVPDDLTTVGSSRSRSAYSLTVLADFEEDDLEQKLWASTSRFLVRKVAGRGHLWVCVVDGTTRAAVSMRAASGPHRFDEVTGELAPEVAEVAEAAARAVPGLRVATVVVSFRHSRRTPRRSDCAVIDVMERPRLDVFGAASTELADRLAAAILCTETDRVGLVLGEPQAAIALTLHLESVADPSGFIERFDRACQRLGLEGTATVTDAVEGVAEATVAGPHHAVARLCDGLTGGFDDGPRAIALDGGHR